MLRQLLTMLAVISGFTLAAEPVSAAEMRAVSVAAAQAGEDCQRVVALPVQQAKSVAAQRRNLAEGFIRPLVAFVPLTVQMQIDRARE